MNVMQVKPADEPPISVAVRFMDGSEETLAVQRSDKLHVMKSQLCAKLGVTLARVKLIFGTQELQSDEKVAGDWAAPFQWTSKEHVRRHMGQMMEKKVNL